jgi:phosphoenolpyruvate carboxylase
MLGYSDSCKDGGVFASQFGLYKAQKQIQVVSQASDLTFRIFHGRGGCASNCGLLGAFLRAFLGP